MVAVHHLRRALGAHGGMRLCTYLPSLQQPMQLGSNKQRHLRSYGPVSMRQRRCVTRC
jgi:hypothetical protein